MGGGERLSTIVHKYTSTDKTKRRLQEGTDDRSQKDDGGGGR